ncbi:hypothetical protein H0H93_014792 [Arthromyces matolae]|nr:hypothetical protein H0H93_014792 [Arthromyces matolae]
MSFRDCGLDKGWTDKLAWFVLKEQIDSGDIPHAPVSLLWRRHEHDVPVYLNERRLSGNESQQNANNNNNSSATASTSGLGLKRSSIEAAGSPDAPTSKRPRGRPKGSKNRAKDGGASAVASSSGSAL